MVLMKFMTSTWSHLKNKLARVILDKISKDEEPDLIDRISTLNYILSTGNFKNISLGWNSPNQEINSKFQNVQEEIFELKKIVKFLSGKIDRKISSGYMEYTDKKIDICLYFRDKNKNQVDVEDSIKSISSLVNELIRSYEKIKEDSGSYEHLVITTIFTELQKTLLSFSLLK